MHFGRRNPSNVANTHFNYFYYYRWVCIVCPVPAHTCAIGVAVGMYALASVLINNKFYVMKQSQNIIRAATIGRTTSIQTLTYSFTPYTIFTTIHRFSRTINKQNTLNTYLLNMFLNFLQFRRYRIWIDPMFSYTKLCWFWCAWASLTGDESKYSSLGVPPKL